MAFDIDDMGGVCKSCGCITRKADGEKCRECAGGTP